MSGSELLVLCSAAADGGGDGGSGARGCRGHAGCSAGLRAGQEAFSFGIFSQCHV